MRGVGIVDPDPDPFRVAAAIMLDTSCFWFRVSISVSVLLMSLAALVNNPDICKVLFCRFGTVVPSQILIGSTEDRCSNHFDLVQVQVHSERQEQHHEKQAAHSFQKHDLSLSFALAAVGIDLSI